MWANNEVGTVQPLDDVVAAARAGGVPVHADAVQAVGQVPVDLRASGLAALSISGHKVGATPGTGALLVSRDVPVTPLLHGGGQERGLRSGTADPAGAAALAAAVTAATAEARGPGAHRVAALRDRLLAGLLALDGVRLRGAPPGPGRLPGNAHVTVAGVRAEVLLFLLDAAGVCASSGAACRSGVEQPSHVLLAMGASEAEAGAALRLTLGHTSTAEDVHAALAVLPEAIARARRASAPLAGVRP
jgi:cysteine desulfurase